MRANPQRELPQSTQRSTTSLTIGRKKPLPLETTLILSQEPVEMMEQHPNDTHALTKAPNTRMPVSSRVLSLMVDISA